MTQVHHIVPQYYYKRLGLPADNSLENIVELSSSQHILAHYFLYNCSLGVMKQANSRNFLFWFARIDLMDIKEQKEAYQEQIDALSKVVIYLETKKLYSGMFKYKKMGSTLLKCTPFLFYSVISPS